MEVRVGTAPSMVSATPYGRVVGLEHGKLMGTSFHPKVHGEIRSHEGFPDKDLLAWTFGRLP